MYPLCGHIASVVLSNTSCATCPLLVSASLRPSNARSHTLSLSPENPVGRIKGELKELKGTGYFNLILLPF